jgi:hypothetical protein
MNTIRRIALTLAVSATAALANDNLTQIRDHARSLEQEFRGMQTAVKSKNFQADELRGRLEATGAGVQKLKDLVAGVEASSPNVVSNPEWKRTKDLVQLLDVFHGRKAELLQGDALKNRSMLKVTAQGLAERAVLLQKSADKLMSSGS